MNGANTTMFENIFKPTMADYFSVFLSHNSINKKYGGIIRELLVNVGISDSQIIYTSHVRNKIPAGENIYEYLSNRLQKSTVVLFLLSDEYFESSSCLNEMGASWIMKNDYYLFFVPGFDQKSNKFLNCCINSNKMGIVLNGDEKCRQGLLEFTRSILDARRNNIDSDIIFDEVEKSCEKLRNITPIDSLYTTKIVEIKKQNNFIFCRLDTLLPTGEPYHTDETHWVQLSTDFVPIADSFSIGNRISFKVKNITAFEKEKYGTKNFRNIYVYRDSVRII